MSLRLIRQVGPLFTPGCTARHVPETGASHFLAGDAEMQDPRSNRRYHPKRQRGDRVLTFLEVRPCLLCMLPMWQLFSSRSSRLPLA